VPGKSTGAHFPHIAVGGVGHAGIPGEVDAGGRGDPDRQVQGGHATGRWRQQQVVHTNVGATVVPLGQQTDHRGGRVDVEIEIAVGPRGGNAQVIAHLVEVLSSVGGDPYTEDVGAARI